MKRYLSYSAGVNSTALMILYENKIDEAIFVDHGGDYPNTYQYITYMEKQGFPITVLKPNVEGFDNLYDFCIYKHLIPSRLFRWCTDKFKIKPITKYVNKPSKMFIGFCIDETKRVKSEFRYRKGIMAKYPLIENEITREGCKEIIRNAGLKVPRKSCCYFCPFQKKLEARELFLNYPKLYQKCKELEKNCMRSDLYIHSKPISEIAMENILPLERYDVEKDRGKSEKDGKK